jgi:ligand-binding sensor domain-containing protein/serine phosphatase RsbU (regulator of sigma subunit)
MLITIAAGTGHLPAQTYFFDNYSTAQGFESKVYAIVQDNSHYLWLGTQSGVTRFDGITFRNYNTEDGLAPGGARVIFIDSGNRIWTGHENGGLSRFNGRTFDRVDIPDTVLHSNITSIIQDQDGQLWITTELDGAIMIRNPALPVINLQYDHFLKGKSLGDQVFNSLCTSNGDLYFITNVGIRKYNKTGNSFESYKPDGMFTYFLTTVMFEDSRGNFWFGTYNGGLSKFSRADGRFSFYDTRNGLAANWVSAITEDRNGNIWIGHWGNDINSGGISCIHPDGKIKVFSTANGLHDNWIWCIREDAEGNMLIGTTEHGLDIYKGERFVSYLAGTESANNQVYTIIQVDPELIWFGTNNGIAAYRQGSEPADFQYYNQVNRFISNHIRFFKKDRKNNIWIGTADQGVLMYDLAGKQFVSQPLINSYLLPVQSLSKGIGALEIGSDGHLWIGTLDGLIEYDIGAGRYVATHTQINGLAGNDISALFTDEGGDLWIGSRNKGLTRLHAGAFTIIDVIGSITPTCIAEDKNGRIWVGTESKGALLIDGDSVRQFTTAEGLLANLVSMIACDALNNIYIGTNRGLNKIDLKQNRITSYTRRTGFTGIETKNNASCIDRDGYLWFGTSNGAIRCNTGLAENDTAAPAVQLIEMRVKGMETARKAGLKLASTENDIAFDYVCIFLTNPEGITYQVMLEGLHDTWQDQHDATSITFSKLQPGRYTFRVRARNNYGAWTVDPPAYSFRILAPFYQRGFFIAIVIAVLLASIATFIKIRERALREEKRILEERVQERTQELSVANEALSMRNKDITDSITYAKRIQFAILPPEIPFSNTFILFRPKDIVSGDFYWMNTAAGKEFMAAVDCTGHGVPGAFMSFIGFTSLNKIIIEQGIITPAAILNRLNKEVATTLHQKGEDIVNDGMDIALISYSPDTGKLEFSGAFNPLILIRNGEMIETKADRFAIGRSTGREKTFTNHVLELEHGDMVYMYSDGYADQFGGDDGKKFKTTNLKEKLVSISGEPIDRQREILEMTFEVWKGDHEQIDDVLIVGRRFV